MKRKLNVQTLRHSTAHLMAGAILELWPEAKFGIGPAIESGFYYDFDLPQTISEKDLPLIEKKMKELAEKNLKFEKKTLSIKQAENLFKKLNQPYKLEILEELKKLKNGEKSPQVTIYKLGNFIDLCKGPHLRSTKQIKFFKLTKVAGAYWKGDEKNKMLQRIYGIAFPTQKELNDYLSLLEEAEKRDHRRLGKELDLFSIDEEVGAGLPLWHPKGAMLRQIIEDFWIKEHLKNGYELVKTPHIGNINLWKTSGHWGFYRENMYSPIKIENEEYLLKPMNCPFHIKIYKSKIRSWRDLPIRWAELGTVYRYEKSGVLHGLVRVRGFTQDDAHIICTKEQLNEELDRVIKLTRFILSSFGFKEYNIYLSIRDPKKKKKYVGDDKIWDTAENALEKALIRNKLKYQRDVGEAKFYGPAIDIKIKDVLGREWQCSTLQLDFNLPERFEIYFINKKGKRETPIMLHRALMGSLERFVAVLIEHYNGAFPVWLAPVQVVIIPVGSNHIKPANKLAQELKEQNIRVEVDQLRETVGNKIRKAEKQKIPYMLVIGDKEAKGRYLNIRERGKKQIKKMTRKQFISLLKEQSTV
ncbi:threonine--tRNA ligase [bacterium]|nr:threonine--tRNA ligase [bacterium]